MSATAVRIAFVREEFRRVVAVSSNPTTRFGNLARESDDPLETFFDEVADAQTIVTARQTLMSVERRKLNVVVVGLDEIMAVDYIGAVPVADYTDTDRGMSGNGLVGEIIIDFNKQQASLPVWG